MKHIICLILALVLAVGICAVPAAAESGKLDPSSIVIDGIRDSAYKESQTLGDDAWAAYYTHTDLWEEYDNDRFINKLYFSFDDEFLYLYYSRTSYDTVARPSEGDTHNTWQDNPVKADLLEAIEIWLDTAPSAPIDQATEDNPELTPSSDVSRNCVTGADPYHRLQCRCFPQFADNEWDNYFTTDEGMFISYDTFCNRHRGEAGFENPEAMYLKANGGCQAATFVDFETNTIGFEMKYRRAKGDASFRIQITSAAREFDWDEYAPERELSFEMPYVIASGPAWWRQFDSMNEVFYADYDPTAPDGEDGSAAVEAMIAALPAANAVTLQDADAIHAARSAYNALTAAAKAKVKNLALLTAAEAKLLSLTVTYGDLNGDQKADASDALTVLKAAVKKVVLTDAQTNAADVNGDLKIDASDALLILKKAVNKISRFPVEEN